MRKLIVITGADGTGKSTLIKQLSLTLESCYCANIWDLLQQSNNTLPFKSKQDIDSFLCALTPDSRFLFLAHALRFSVDKALQSEAKIILMDSYYYKYFASELALGANPILVRSVLDSFPEPDLVFELIVPLTEVMNRKENFSRYECGLADIAHKDLFEKFQQKVYGEWKGFSFKHHVKVNAMQTVEQVTEEVMSIISEQ